jgi:hypothetical protein
VLAARQLTYQLAGTQQHWKAELRANEQFLAPHVLCLATACMETDCSSSIIKAKLTACCCYLLFLQTLMDPERRATYDALAGFSANSINPFMDASLPADQVFVDEFTCIGCRNVSGASWGHSTRSSSSSSSFLCTSCSCFAQLDAEPSSNSVVALACSTFVAAQCKHNLSNGKTLHAALICSFKQPQSTHPCCAAAH